MRERVLLRRTEGRLFQTKRIVWSKTEGGKGERNCGNSHSGKYPEWV